MKNAVSLRPTYWASVSGGKDSLYMLKLIFENPETYPIDGVVHFELETDFPFIKNVIDYMESECKKHSVPFMRIAPRVPWGELYDKYGYPSRVARWCNSKYKLDCSQQLENSAVQSGKYVVYYIGFCADEIRRFKNVPTQIYPIADFGIDEHIILHWAKTQPIFNDYYIYNRRCGCMLCPCSSYINFAYLYKYYPNKYAHLMGLCKKSERERGYTTLSGKYSAEYIDAIVKTKYAQKIDEIHKSYEIEKIMGVFE